MESGLRSAEDVYFRIKVSQSINKRQMQGVSLWSPSTDSYSTCGVDTPLKDARWNIPGISPDFQVVLVVVVQNMQWKE